MKATTMPTRRGVLLAGEPLHQARAYDFAASDLFGCVFAQGREQSMNQGYAGTPPPHLLFPQRKFVGTFLLCTRLFALFASHRGPAPVGRASPGTLARHPS